MATPIIQSTGSTSGAGTAGQGRDDLVLSETVTLSDTEAANSGASYSWTLEDIPIGSSTTLTSPLTATPTFSPDTSGSYRVRCLVDGTDFSVEVLAVATANKQFRIPSFGEETEYDAGGNAKGWHQAMDEFIREVDGQGAFKDLEQEFTKNQRSAIVTLTDAATTTIDASASNVFELTATGGVGATRELDNPTNLVAGMTWIVIFIQDGTGGRALTFDTYYDFGDESAPDFTSQGASVKNVISCVALTTTQIATTVLTGF